MTISAVSSSSGMNGLIDTNTAENPRCDQYVNYVLELLEVPQIKQDTVLKSILGGQVDRLIDKNQSLLPSEEETMVSWVRKLIGEDRKVRTFVADKLKEMYGKLPHKYLPILFYLLLTCLPLNLSTWVGAIMRGSE